MTEWCSLVSTSSHFLRGHSNYQIGPNLTKSHHIGVNRTKSEIPSTKSGPYCKVQCCGPSHTQPLWTKVIGPHRTTSQTPITKSAPFLPCDAMHSAAIAVTRCPPVCLSVTFVSCAKTNKDIFEIFSPSGSQAILVFPYQTGWRYSDGWAS